MWKYLIQIAYNKLLIGSPGKLVVQLFQLGFLFRGCNWLSKGKEKFLPQFVGHSKPCSLHRRITLMIFNPPPHPPFFFFFLEMLLLFQSFIFQVLSLFWNSVIHVKNRDLATCNLPCASTVQHDNSTEGKLKSAQFRDGGFYVEKERRTLSNASNNTGGDFVGGEYFPLRNSWACKQLRSWEA